MSNGNDIQRDPITILITPFKDEDILFFYLNENKTLCQCELEYIVEQVEAGCAFGSTYHLHPEGETTYGGYFGYAGTTEQLN